MALQTWVFRSNRSLEVELLGGKFRDRRIGSGEVLSEELERADAREVLEWVSAHVKRLAVTTSFQSSGLVILHMLRAIRPDVPVLFLNTGFHFPETLAFRERMTKEWDLNLIELRGDHGSPERQAAIYGPALYERRPDQCCTINKVEPLQRALEGYDAWISGLRRDQSAARSEIPAVTPQTLPSGRDVVKVHPLAAWTKSDINAYLSEHDIPTHPLLERGFASIGCRPCTRPVRRGEDDRVGRWDGVDKTECGIHSLETGEFVP